MGFRSIAPSVCSRTLLVSESPYFTPHSPSSLCPTLPRSGQIFLYPRRVSEHYGRTAPLHRAKVSNIFLFVERLLRLVPATAQLARLAVPTHSIAKGYLQQSIDTEETERQGGIDFCHSCRCFENFHGKGFLPSGSSAGHSPRRAYGRTDERTDGLVASFYREQGPLNNAGPQCVAARISVAAFSV